MNKCDFCNNAENTHSIRTCLSCKRKLCDKCSYYSRFYRLIKEDGYPDKAIIDENYFCRIHFVEFIKEFSSDLLEDIVRNNFFLKGNFEENGKKTFFEREFQGDQLKELISEVIDAWPSDEWKDWNTM